MLLELTRNRTGNLLFFVVFIALLGANASCAHLPKQLREVFERDTKTIRGNGNSLLGTMPLPETGVELDVYVIYVPYDRRNLLEQFWNDVEESEIPIQTRNALFNHGLRQGMLSAKIPVSLERLLELRDIPPQRPFEKVIGADTLAGGDPLHKRLTVPMMHKQPVEFPTCDPIPRLPVLAVVDGNLTGQVYSDAKGVILISTEEQPDGSVIIKTIPEIHHGDDVRKPTSSGGVLKRAVYRSKLSFDQLAVETKLLLGQWVVIGPENRHTAGFGQDILSRNKGTSEQILIAIRLQRTRKDGIHDRNDIVILPAQAVETNPSRQNGEDEKDSGFPTNLADQELGKNPINQAAASLFD